MSVLTIIFDCLICSTLAISSADSCTATCDPAVNGLALCLRLEFPSYTSPHSEVSSPHQRSLTLVMDAVITDHDVSSLPSVSRHFFTYDHSPHASLPVDSPSYVFFDRSLNLAPHLIKKADFVRRPHLKQVDPAEEIVEVDVVQTIEGLPTPPSSPMAKPTIDQDTELSTKKAIADHATLGSVTSSGYKSFVSAMNDFIKENEPSCNSTPRLWKRKEWVALAAKFVKEYGESVWDIDRPGLTDASFILPNDEEDIKYLSFCMLKFESSTYFKKKRAAAGSDDTKAGADAPASSPSVPKKKAKPTPKAAKPTPQVQVKDVTESDSEAETPKPVRDPFEAVKRAERAVSRRSSQSATPRQPTPISGYGSNSRSPSKPRIALQPSFAMPSSPQGPSSPQAPKSAGPAWNQNVLELLRSPSTPLKHTKATTAFEASALSKQRAASSKKSATVSASPAARGQSVEKSASVDTPGKGAQLGNEKSEPSSADGVEQDAEEEEDDEGGKENEADEEDEHDEQNHEHDNLIVSAEDEAADDDEDETMGEADFASVTAAGAGDAADDDDDDDDDNMITLKHTSKPNTTRPKSASKTPARKSPGKSRIPAVSNQTPASPTDAFAAAIFSQKPTFGNRVVSSAKDNADAQAGAGSDTKVVQDNELDEDEPPSSKISNLTGGSSTNPPATRPTKRVNDSPIPFSPNDRSGSSALRNRVDTTITPHKEDDGVSSFQAKLATAAATTSVPLKQPQGTAINGAGAGAAAGTACGTSATDGFEDINPASSRSHSRPQAQPRVNTSAQWALPAASRLELSAPKPTATILFNISIPTLPPPSSSASSRNVSNTSVLGTDRELLDAAINANANANGRSNTRKRRRVPSSSASEFDPNAFGEERLPVDSEIEEEEEEELTHYLILPLNTSFPAFYGSLLLSPSIANDTAAKRRLVSCRRCVVRVPALVPLSSSSSAAPASNKKTLTKQAGSGRKGTSGKAGEATTKARKYVFDIFAMGTETLWAGLLARVAGGMRDAGREGGECEVELGFEYGGV